jgi:hypothetical protein
VAPAAAGAASASPATMDAIARVGLRTGAS